jgi:hypothetical protein
LDVFLTNRSSQLEKLMQRLEMGETEEKGMGRPLVGKGGRGRVLAANTGGNLSSSPLLR